MIRLDTSGAHAGAEIIFAQPAVRELVLVNPRTDARVRAHLAKLIELERVHGPQRALFDEVRPRVLWR